MEIPNFDSMNQDELRSFWSKWHVTTRNKASEIVGNRSDAHKIVEVLACYALNKSIAIGLRLEGKISTAMKYEDDCQRAYERLPADVRW
jgi:hypothetical protein